LAAQSGDPRAEEKYLEQALAGSEDNLVLKILLARAQEKNGKSEAALKTTEAVLEDISKAEDPARLIASLGQSLNTLLGGDETLLEQYETRKDDYAAQLLTGLIALNRAAGTGLNPAERQSALESALERFTEVKRIKPASPFGYRLMAIANLRLGRTDEALRQLQEWLSIRPSDRLARIEAARLLATRGDSQLALEQIDQAVQTDPGDMTALLAKASILAASPLRQTEQAIQIVQELLKARPGETRAASLLLTLLSQQGRLDEAVGIAEEFLKNSPLDYTILTQLGEIYLRKGENLKALLCYQKTIEISPYAAQTANNLAYAYAVVGQQLDKALELAQQALNAYPGNPRILDTLGFVYFKKEDWASAIEVFGEALDIDPTQATTRYYLAESYFRSGDRELARKHLEQALQQDFPERKEAERLRDQIGQS
jgi:tetratricopeptide (TPR) repeat protein